MDWKKRRVQTTGLVRRVAIVGGTHGNEANGVHLAKHFMRNPDVVKRSSFETEVFLSNEKAIQQNTRYVDEDLNRCYLLQDLADDANAARNNERKRAMEVDAILGPKNSTEPRCDFVIDLHNTTAATDIALLMAPHDAFSHELAHHLMGLDKKVRVVDWNPQNDWSLCASVGRSGMTFEVGPCPWGCIVPELFQRSLRLVLALLDYIDLRNEKIKSGMASTRSKTMPVYRSLGSMIDYPREANGEIVGMIHPKLQGRDFEELREGDDLFALFGGGGQKFARQNHKVPSGTGAVYPAFVNEAAYYEKKIALMLFDKGETTYEMLA